MINIFIGKDTTPAVIDEVLAESPAYAAGLKKNDKIISIDNNKVKSILEVSTFINASTSEELEFIILRNESEISLYVKPRVEEGKDSFGNSVKKRMVGIKLAPPLNNEFQKERLGVSKAIFSSINEVWFVCITSLKYLGAMIFGSADSSQLGGPIRIAKISGQVAEFGIIPFISMMAYISISLG